jgi:hypothetical protein
VTDELNASNEVVFTRALLSAKNQVKESPSRFMMIKKEFVIIDNNVRYCHVKMLNTSMQYLQLGKTVKINRVTWGTMEQKSCFHTKLQTCSTYFAERVFILSKIFC